MSGPEIETGNWCALLADIGLWVHCPGTRIGAEARISSTRVTVGLGLTPQNHVGRENPMLDGSAPATNLGATNLDATDVSDTDSESDQGGEGGAKSFEEHHAIMLSRVRAAHMCRPSAQRPLLVNINAHINDRCSLAVDPAVQFH